MSLPATFPLKAANGKTITIPAVGYGTWASGENSWCKDATLAALKAGYRHLDCAWMYGVDGAVGDAIRESGIPREEIFVTSKFWPNFAHPHHVELCLDKVLKGMGLEYIDLWLAHWPVAFESDDRAKLENARTGHDTSSEDKGITNGENGKPIIAWEYSAAHLAKLEGKQGSYLPVFKAMQECVRKGKTRTIGVSNFSISEVKELLAHEVDVPLSCNQVEVHPWLPQMELIEFCKSQGILVTCYSPFAGQIEGGKSLVKDEKVLELAKKNNMDAGQLLQSWAVTRGTSPLGKSATPSRIKTNLAVKKLSDEDMKALDSLEIPNDGGRTVNPGKGWGIQLFKD